MNHWTDNLANHNTYYTTKDGDMMTLNVDDDVYRLSKIINFDGSYYFMVGDVSVATIPHRDADAFVNKSFRLIQHKHYG